MTKWIVVLLSGLTLAAAQPDPKVVQEVLAASDAWKAAMMKKDAAGLQKLMHEDMIYSHSSGMMQTKADVVKATTTGKTTIEAMDFSETTPTHFGALIADTTWAHQVANAVILQAPLLVYSANPANMLPNPTVDVLKSIPSTWDETVVLPVSEIRQVAAFARRSGNTWFLAITNGATARNVRIDLSAFLAKGAQPQGGRGASYHATLVRDTGEPAAVKIEHLTLGAGDSLSVDLRSGGGFVAMLKR